MGDETGRVIPVDIVGVEGLTIDTRGPLTLLPDRLLFVSPQVQQRDRLGEFSIPLGPDTVASVERNAGQPESAGHMVFLRWDGKGVRFVHISEGDAESIARHVANARGGG